MNLKKKLTMSQGIIKKYPKIFVQHKLPMTQTCMCWGVECSEGWFRLIDTLCASLQWDTDKNGYPQVVATQVKEKYGTLRFYYTWENDGKKYEDRKYAHQEGMISFAEHISGYMCEYCGAVEGVTQTKGWIVTLCPKHMRAYKKKRGIK